MVCGGRPGKVTQKKIDSKRLKKGDNENPAEIVHVQGSKVVVRS
jgi:hypothetical protein